MTDVNKIIAEMVEAKTFGLEAIDSIKQLRDENVDLKAANDSKTAQIERLNHNNKLGEEELDRLRNKIDTRETTIRDNEVLVANAIHAKYQAEKSAAVTDAYKSCFETVFRPAAIRESIQRKVAVPTSNSQGMAYPTIMDENESKETTQV